MGINIENIETLKEYFTLVVERAEHHAHGVNDIIYTLLGFVILKASHIEARQYKDKPANMLKITIKDKILCLSYNHTNGSIDIKEKNNNGNILCTFDNTSTTDDIKTFFNNI